MTQHQPWTGSEHPSRTRDGKMRVRRLADGWVSDHHAPDATVLVDSGAYEFVPVAPTRADDLPSVVPSTFPGPIPAGAVLAPEPPESPAGAVARLRRELAAAEATAAIRAEPVRRVP